MCNQKIFDKNDLKIFLSKLNQNELYKINYILENDINLILESYETRSFPNSFIIILKDDRREKVYYTFEIIKLVIQLENNKVISISKSRTCKPYEWSDNIEHQNTTIISFNKRRLNKIYGRVKSCLN